MSVGLGAVCRRLRTAARRRMPMHGSPAPKNSRRLAPHSTVRLTQRSAPELRLLNELDYEEIAADSKII